VSRPRTDYSHELRLSGNPLLRYLYAGLGLFFTGVGVVGVFVPGLPTTVFILIATYFFARSSPRFYNWVMNHRVFGSLIRDWRAGLGLSRRAKVAAVTTISLTIGLSAYLIGPLPVKLLVIACGLGVSLYLLTRPTKPAA
jgi:uncharacterized protein